VVVIFVIHETVVDEGVKFDEAGEYKFVVTHNVQADRNSWSDGTWIDN